MSAPGWYPDPRGGGGRRYWDGARWTDQVRPPGQYPQSPERYPQPGHQQPQFPNQGQGQWPQPAGQGHGSAGTGGSTVALWITLVVSVALIIGLGAWLLFFREPAPQTTPAPPPPPTTEATTPQPEPSTPGPTSASPEPGTADPEPSTPEPDPTSTQPADAPVAKGDVLTPATCEGAADDAVGQENADGRYESALGLSFPAVDGFTAVPIQYPWVWGSNSQYKPYDGDWMASVTVGHLEAAEGFEAHDTAAVRLVECILGSPFYGEQLAGATVFAVDSQPENATTWLDVDVDVTGVAGVQRDWLTVVTAEYAGELHVGIAVAPDSSEEDYELVQEAFTDLRFP